MKARTTYTQEGLDSTGLKSMTGSLKGGVRLSGMESRNSFGLIVLNFTGSTVVTAAPDGSFYNIPMALTEYSIPGLSELHDGMACPLEGNLLESVVRSYNSGQRFLLEIRTGVPEDVCAMEYMSEDEKHALAGNGTLEPTRVASVDRHRSIMQTVHTMNVISAADLAYSGKYGHYSCPTAYTYFEANCFDPSTSRSQHLNDRRFTDVLRDKTSGIVVSIESDSERDFWAVVGGLLIKVVSTDHGDYDGNVVVTSINGHKVETKKLLQESFSSLLNKSTTYECPYSKLDVEVGIFETHAAAKEFSLLTITRLETLKVMHVKQKSDHDAELANLKKTNKEALDSKEAELKADIKEAARQHKKSMDDKDAAHKEAMDKLRRDYDTAKKEADRPWWSRLFRAIGNALPEKIVALASRWF